MRRDLLIAVGLVLALAGFVAWGVVNLARAWRYVPVPTPPPAAAVARQPVLVTVPAATAVGPASAASPEPGPTMAATVEFPAGETPPAPPSGSPTLEPEAGASPVAVATASPVAPTSSEATAPVATPEANARAWRWMTGLTLATIRTRLQTTFETSCGDPAPADGLLIWKCGQGTAGGTTTPSLVVSGLDQSRIVSIRGFVPLPDAAAEEPAGRFLEAVAGLPFEGSTAQQAGAWTLAHMVSGGQTRIGGLLLIVHAPPGVRTLEIFAPQEGAE